jgi:hypothetical protein
LSPIPGDLVGAKCALGAVKGLLGEQLDVSLAGGTVGDGLLVCVLILRNLETLEQHLRVGEDVLVGIVEALADDLIDRVTVAWRDRLSVAGWILERAGIQTMAELNHIDIHQ